MVKTIVKIGESGDSILTRKAKRVPHGMSVKGIASIMLDTMRENKGAGLSAPQINLSMRLFVAELEGHEVALVNPVITSTSIEQETKVEACLSIPDVSVPVKRPVGVVVRAIDLEGKMVRLEVAGDPARIVQHEIDHLDGVLITHKVDTEWQGEKTENGTSAEIVSTEKESMA